MRFTLALLASNVAEWAYFVAALVYAFDRAGARATGFASIALLLPIALAGPAAGAASTRTHPSRVRFMSFAVQAAALGVAGAVALADGPVAAVVAACALATGAFTFLSPACAVLLPGMVRSARELTKANTWISGCDSVSALVGSALAMALLAVEGPASVLAAGAALNVISAAITASDRTAQAIPAGSPAPERESSVRQLLRCVRGLRQRPGITGVLTLAGAQHVVVGALDLIVVVLARDTLSMGESGPGLLSTSVGLGALVFAITSALLVRRARLGPLLAAALVGVTASTGLLGVAPAVWTALVLLPVAGFSRALLDLSSKMLLQRATPPEDVAAVFGAIELFGGVGLLAGSIIAQVLIGVSGVRAALIGVAALFLALMLVTARSLRRADDSADIPIVAISLLRRIPAFAPLQPLAMETLARAAEEMPVAAGTIVIKEGDEGDSYYAVEDGVFDVSMEGEYVRSAHCGDGFGEIALLANTPRTATIVARQPGRLLAIRREPFLSAVTGSDASRRAAIGMVRAVGVEIAVDGDE